jgi:Cd2+/Zn2+-exporting ATPase
VSEKEERRPLPAPWRNARVITSVLSGLLLLAGWLTDVAGGPAAASTAAYLTAMAVGGFFFAGEAAQELVSERRIGIELLMTVAAVAAALLGQFFEAAMLVFLYSIAEALEGYAEQKTRGAVG